MDILKKFINDLCGDFNNDKQIEEQENKGETAKRKIGEEII